jgi:Fe2+ transport system protein FeoA
MFFGKFLLDKKIITASQLIQAIATQSESKQSIFGFIQENKLISDEDFANAINVSSVKNTTIQNIILESKLLTQVQLSDLNQEITRKGISLGKALLINNSIESDKLNEMLKEYLETENTSNVSDSTSAAETNEPDVAISSAALDSLKELGITDGEEFEELEAQSASVQEDPSEKTDVAISSAALDSLKELGITDGEEFEELEAQSASVQEDPSEKPDVAISSAALDSLKELGITDGEEFEALESKVVGLEFEGVKEEGYLDIFTSDLFEKSKSNIKSLSKGFDEDTLKELSHSISNLLSASSREGYKFSEKLYNCYQHLFFSVLEKKVDFTNINFLEFATNSKEAFNFAWELKENIIANGNEIELLNNQDWKARYLKNLKCALSIARNKD